MKSARYFYRFLVTLCVAVLFGCGGGSSGGGGCRVDTNDRLAQESARFDDKLRDMADSHNELSLRDSELDPVYDLGFFLSDGNFERSVDVSGDTLPTTDLQRVTFESNELSIRGDSLSQSAFVTWSGVAVGEEIRSASNETLFFSSSLEITELRFRQLDNLQEVIDSNLSKAPNANQFVYGIYEGKVKTTINVENECNNNDTIGGSVQAASGFLEANATLSVVERESSNGSIVIESDEIVPIAYLIRDLDSEIPFPLNLSASVERTPEISLTWDSLPSIQNYRVYYSETAGFERNDPDVLTQDISSTNFVLGQDVEFGGSWHFRVAAISGGKVGALSPPLTVTIPTGPPETALVLSGSALGDGTVRLTWGRPDGNDANLYTIFRKTSVEADWIELASFSPVNPSQRENFRLREYIDSNVTLGATYYYAVTYSNPLSPPVSPLSQETAITVVDEIIDDNEPPVAEAGTDEFVEEGQRVNLNGSRSFDPDSSRALEYSWAASPENEVRVELENSTSAIASFNAPEIDETILGLTFILTVSDGVTSSVDTVLVTVLNDIPASPGPGINQPPEVNVALSQSEVFEGDPITLDASGSFDPENQPLSFTWHQLSHLNFDLGISGSNEAALELNAPFDVEQSITLQFLVQVSDGQNTERRTVDIVVNNRGDEADGLELAIEAYPNPAEPGESLFWQLTVTNTSDFERENISIETLFPATALYDMLNTFVSHNGGCTSPGRTDRCDTEDEIVKWEIPKLSPGQGTAVVLSPVVSESVDISNPITINVRANDTLGSNIAAEKSLALVGSRFLELAITADKIPALPGETVIYTLTYGFKHTSVQATDVALNFDFPETLLFMNTNNNGQLNGNRVTWHFPALNPGATGTVSVELKIPENAPTGRIITSSATLSGLNGQVRSSTQADKVIWVDSSSPLQLAHHVTRFPTEAGEQNVSQFNVSNTSQQNYQNVKLFFPIEDSFTTVQHYLIDKGGSCNSGSRCIPGQWASWNIGNIAAGQVLQFSVPPATESDLSPGELINMRPWLEYNDGTVHSGAHTLPMVADRQLEIALSSNENRVLPGELVKLNLTYLFNAVSAQAEDVVLELVLPESLSFRSSSTQGLFNGRSVVWNLGTLRPSAAQGQQWITAFVNPNLTPGHMIPLEAHIRDNQTRWNKTNLILPVVSNRPLTVSLNTGTRPHNFNELQLIELAIGNTSEFPRSDVNVNLRFPVEWQTLRHPMISDNGQCSPRGSNRCEVEGERIVWHFDTIEANSAVIVDFSPRTDASGTDKLIQLEASITDSAGTESSASDHVIFGSSRDAELNLNIDRNPVAPGDVAQIFIHYGINAPEFLSGTSLVLLLPDGIEAIAASNNGVIDGNRIIWALSELSLNTPGQLSAVININDDNTLLGSNLRIDSYVTHVDNTANSALSTISSTLLSIEQTRELELTASFDQEFAIPNTPIGINLSVTNKSPFARTNIVLSMIYPEYFSVLQNAAIDGGGCTLSLGSTNRCDTAGEKVIWIIPELPANSTQDFRLEPVVRDTVPAGTLIPLKIEAADDTTRGQSYATIGVIDAP